MIRAILGGEEEAFWNAEAAERQAAQVPPFGRLAAIIISAPEAERAFDLGNHLLRNAGPLQAIGAQIFDPHLHHCACAIALSRAYVDQGGKISAAATRLGAMDCAHNVKRRFAPSVDIDPQSFL